MTRVVLSGTPAVAVVLRRSARARRFSLRVSRVDGGVSLTLPAAAAHAQALEFIREKEAWIRRKLNGLPTARRPGHGGAILFAGKEIPIIAGSGRSLRLRGGALHVPGPPAAVPARVRGFLQVEAQAQLGQAVRRYCGSLGVEAGAITLRDTRSRWGSCSPRGRLMFSWRLVMAPPAVLAYVAAHEVAHLREMNHSPAFWRIVRSLRPGYAAERSWLKANGATLQAWRFHD